MQFDAALDEPIENPFTRLVRRPKPLPPGVIDRGAPPPGWKDDVTAAKHAMAAARAQNMGVPR